MGAIRCLACGGDEGRTVNTYKSRWLWCSSCGSATRRTKDRYLFEFIPSFVIRRVPKLRRLLPSDAVLDDHSRIYDYMAGEGHVEQHRKAGAFERYIELVIEPQRIDLRDKRILDVSAGNGDFPRRFRDLGAEVAMTEFNKKSVEYARSQYGLEAEVYDFNHDDISALFDGKFDVVMLRHAIMFCVDPAKLFREIAQMLAPGGIVILHDSVVPTIGAFLRWQLDDYTYLVLYEPECLLAKIESAGFECMSRFPVAPYGYTERLNPVAVALCWAYEVPAAMRFRRRERVQRGESFILRPSAPN